MAVRDGTGAWSTRYPRGTVRRGSHLALLPRLRSGESHRRVTRCIAADLVHLQNEEGLDKFFKAFSWPGGFPSHVNAETPGCIHEGGELGYALSVAYGSVLDSPDLITVVVVGDGESETGPTAAAWHSHKWIDPKNSGAVLPVLHVNGFKISERTLPGTMDELELATLYSGYGYEPCIVDYVGAGTPTMGGNDPADLNLTRDLSIAFEWYVPSRLPELVPY